MTRVLFLTESFHPVLGGGETQIRELARRLAASGMPATVLARRSEAALASEETLDGVRVVRVAPSGAGRAGKYAMVAPALARLRRERDAYDVLVVRGTRVLGLPGLLAARLHRKPVVMQAEVNGELSGEVYTWGTRLDSPPGRAVVGVLARARGALLLDADAFVAMSRAVAAEFADHGVPTQKLRLIPHGVDLFRFRPANAAERTGLRRRLHLPEDALVVTYTGRLLRGKGLESLVDAFADVASRQSAAHLLLVGSGAGHSLSVEPQLRERASRSGISERIVFAGRVENVEDYLRASDVFVLPSVFEALGLALVEAAACGLPCIGSRTGGIVDVIEDGRSGLLVEPADTRGLAEALDVLLADPERRRTMGERSRELARERFDVEEGVARYRALFRELAGA